MTSASQTTGPVFVVTMGDPAGIGPEIALKALCRHPMPPDYRVVLVGDLAVLRETAATLGLDPPFRIVTALDDITPGTLPVIDLRMIGPGEVRLGQVNASCGAAAYAYIRRAIDLAKDGSAAGVITNPISKEALREAGLPYPGHTEIFAHETGCRDFAMLFYLDGVGVTHVTTHCSLRQAIELVVPERVHTHIILLERAMRRLGVQSPRLAVGGLNPHAGENGLFGDEEKIAISPAIERARGENIDVQGPFPPDTVFMRAFKGEFDGVVSMLHDHGFVALKSRDFEHGVNITVGLPIIRTSVGHGTAFDKAGKGEALERSLLTAIDAVWRLLRNRNIHY